MYYIKSILGERVEIVNKINKYQTINMNIYYTFLYKCSF